MLEALTDSSVGQISYRVKEKLARFGSVELRRRFGQPNHPYHDLCAEPLPYNPPARSVSDIGPATGTLYETMTGRDRTSEFDSVVKSLQSRQVRKPIPCLLYCYQCWQPFCGCPTRSLKDISYCTMVTLLYMNLLSTSPPHCGRTLGSMPWPSLP